MGVGGATVWAAGKQSRRPGEGRCSTAVLQQVRSERQQSGNREASTWELSGLLIRCRSVRQVPYRDGDSLLDDSCALLGFREQPGMNLS